MYIPLKLENPVMVPLYYGKRFIYDCDIEVSKARRCRLDIIERTY